MIFDFSNIPDPTPEELKMEGAFYTQSKSAGAYPGYRKNSEETKKKISQSLKGNIPWNKGKNGVQIPSEETRKRMSESHKKYSSDEERQEARREQWRKANRKRRGPLKRKSSS